MWLTGQQPPGLGGGPLPATRKRMAQGGHLGIEQAASELPVVERNRSGAVLVSAPHQREPNERKRDRRPYKRP